MHLLTRIAAVALAAMCTGVVPVAAQSQTELVQGEVKKVDKDAQKITLKHGELKAFEMPPMTMIFRVKEPTLLDKAKVGDKVRFSVEKSNGAFVVTTLEVTP